MMGRIFQLLQRGCAPRRKRLPTLLCLFALAVIVIIYLQEPDLQPDFKLVFPFIEPNIATNEKNIYLAVVVNSAAKGEDHRALRKAIRKTWGNSSTPGNNTFSWKLVFTLAIADNQPDHETNLKEATEHNDIIIGNFTDIYINVVMKTFMAHYWAVTRLSCRYVLKTDDDVYVRVPSLIRWLEMSGTPSPFYGGVLSQFTVVPRSHRFKWHITMEQYNETHWPPWCHGSYHVLSTDIIPKYLKHTSKRKPFHTDDAYIGVVSKDLGVKAIHIPGFILENEIPERVRTHGELIVSIAMGHKLDPVTMIKYHTFYREHKLD